MNISHILNQVIQEYLPFIKKKNLNFINRIDKNLPFIEADENKLKQIINTFLDNAIKFTEKGFIEINSYIQKPFLIIEVTDR